MSREKCPDCGEYHTVVVIPSWLEGPLHYMLMLVGTDIGASRIERINELLETEDDRRMSAAPLSHFVIHCANFVNRDAVVFGKANIPVIAWNDAILKVLSSDMTHFVQNVETLRQLALQLDISSLPGEHNPFETAIECTDDDWYRAVVRAHFYSSCLQMVAMDAEACRLYAVMATSMIGNNCMTLIRAKYHVSDESAVSKAELVTSEYRRVAVETLDAVISSFETRKAN